MEHDQWEIAKHAMEEIGSIGLAFERDKSMSALLAFEESLIAIHSEIMNVDLEGRSSEQKERVKTWLSTIEGWMKQVKEIKIKSKILGLF